MTLTQFSQLFADGFAGVRMREIVKDSRLFGTHGGRPHAAGIGDLVYFSDAAFVPHGETHMHAHREIDVVTVVLKGRIMHLGSLGNGQMLQAYDVQIQRAGGTGFRHNEVNPDSERNHVLQIWLLPERPGLAPECRVYAAPPSSATRVYGGPSSQSEVLPAKTSVDIVRLNTGEVFQAAGNVQIYVAEGSVQIDALDAESGDLIEMNNPRCVVRVACTLVVIYADISMAIKLES